MTIFNRLTAADVAAQHQVLIDLLLHRASLGSADLREAMAGTIDKMVSEFAANGQDTTLLADAAASLRLRYDEA